MIFSTSLSVNPTTAGTSTVLITIHALQLTSSRPLYYNHNPTICIIAHYTCYSLLRHRFLRYLYISHIKRHRQQFVSVNAVKCILCFYKCIHSRS